MILEASFLKKVLDLLNHTSEPFLEIVSTYEQLSIGANYNDNFYIEYIHIDSENDEEFHIIMNPETLQKIHQLVTLWPKSILQIMGEGEHQVVEIINSGKLTREKPVQVDCIFEEGVKDYSLDAPEMKPNISVNSRNLKQMLEFCQVQTNDVLLSIDSKSLLINNETKTLGTRVECEEFFSNPNYTMKLSAEANRLIISFLTGLGIKTSMIYLMFLERDYAFSVKVKLSDKDEVQIYTIHES